MKIGIFGGTFNPPHKAHLNIAREFAKKLSLDKVMVIPTYQPPHKQAADLASGEDRLEMCRLLFSDDIFSVSDLELRRQGKSYTYDTLCEIEGLYEQAELFLIIGSDMLLSFHQWYRYGDILKKCTLCVLTREADVDNDDMMRYAADTLKLGSEDIIFSSLGAYEMSSTQVRQALFSGDDTDELLTEEVRAYIKEKGLYADKYNVEKITELLGERLDDYRFAHSIGVARMARALAKIHGEDPYRAYVAGLVHDITKNTPGKEQLQIIAKGGIILNSEEENNHKLWHAISGSVYVRDVLGIEDEEIVSAVRYHTTGKAGMTTLEKIVYVADFVSFERNFPGVSYMRELAYESLDKACLFAVDFCIPNLVERRQVLHPDSVALYNELIINNIKYRKEDEDEQS